MKRLLGALFLALVVALVGPIGVAGAKPPHDFTTGGGKVVSTPTDTDDFIRVEKFAFSAHHEGDSSSTPVARNGHYVYHQTITLSDGTFFGEFDIKGSVDCVLVSGNQAVFSGPIEKSKSSNNVLAPPVGAQAFFRVADNDSIGTPDEFRFLGFQAQPPQSCADFLPEPTITPITSGNILVNDAP